MLQNTFSEGTVKTADSSKLNDDCMTGTPIISKLLLGKLLAPARKNYSNSKQKRYIQQACAGKWCLFLLLLLPGHKNAKPKKLTNTKPYLLLASSINKYK